MEKEPTDVSSLNATALTTKSRIAVSYQDLVSLVSLGLGKKVTGLEIYPSGKTWAYPWVKDRELITVVYFEENTAP